MYGTRFYDEIRTGIQASASALVPIIHELCEPTTVIDVGCGEGWWAQAFRDRGAVVLGLDDGDMVSPLGDRFIRHDLRQPLPELTADVVVCLEVAEHLPPGRSDSFIAELCAIAPIVMFSAAIPGQGGTGHVNEQWPDYWASKFEAHGHRVTGALRSLIWDDDRIENWYRQNLLLAVEGYDSRLAHLFEGRDVAPRRLVHPILYDARRPR